MGAESRVLILSADTALVSRIQEGLRRGGIAFTDRVLASAEALGRELEGFRPDLLIADTACADGLLIAGPLKARRPGCALLLVGGRLGEEKVAELVRGGADDYLLSDKLERLAPAASRSLIDAQKREQLYRAERSLREREERYALALRGANDGIYDWNLKTNLVFYSDRWKGIFGHKPEDVSSSINEWFSRVQPDDLAHLRLRIDVHLQGLTPQLETECRMKHKNGFYVSVLVRGIALRDDTGVPVRLAGSITDITDRKRAEEQLTQSTFYDALTNLPNRALFIDRLGQAIRILSRRHESMFALLMLDLDRFQRVNETFGHTVGDQLIRELATRLEKCMRPGDTVARLGGDEFGMLLEDLKEPGEALRIAERVAERVLTELRKPYTLGENPVISTASIGIVVGTAEYEKPEDIMRDGDAALYKAKSLGRDRLEIFERTMHTDSLTLLRTEVDLRQAIEQNEFLVHFQPIVSLRTGLITGCEALVRWKHPKRGIVPPNQFIPLAEENGMIVAIGDFVLREAAKQVHAWHEKGHPLTVAVNLSPRQFQQRDLRQMIANALADTRLEPARLKLELTEGAVMHNPEHAAKVLAELQNLGIRFSLDDFGTGYSSLAYLKRFPITTLKIDRSFVKDIPADSDAASIATAIVQMAHSLKMDVVAEGVETADQRTFLAGTTCDEGQGYLWSKPVSAEEFEKLLSNGHSKPA